jgi:hypothetical protein
VSGRYRLVELSRLDPIERPESPWRVALTIAAVVAYAVLLGGCGASTLDRATTAYGVAHALQSGAVATVRREVRDDLRESCAGETSPAAIDACVTERAERWRAAEAGLDVSAAALSVRAALVGGRGGRARRAPARRARCQTARRAAVVDVRR